MMLFDEIERRADNPAANEAIHVMPERIGLRIGLYFEEGLKGTRKVRKVTRVGIALGNLPLPEPLYGEAQVVPAVALEADVQRPLAAEFEADAGHPGTAAPTIEPGSCCRPARPWRRTGKSAHRDGPRRDCSVSCTTANSGGRT